MRKSVTIVLIACFAIASFGGINVSGDGEPAVEIGQYERVTGSGDLSGEHIEEFASGLRVEGPLFTDTLRVAEGFVESEVGEAWAANKAFVLENGEVVVAGRTVEFSPLEVGPAAVFTLGSRDQIQFQDRPMWVSAQQDVPGATITLDMEDGDKTGQEVFIAKDWLWAHGIHRPVVVHEDGTQIPAVPTDSQDGWMVDMHHFTYIRIDPTEMVVFSRQDGLVVPHTGDVRWYEDELRLEVDVGGDNDCGVHIVDCSAIDQDVLVDKDWLDMKIDYLALREHPWVITEYEGDSFYQVNLTSEQTPNTLVYELFDPSNLQVRHYTAGSGESIFGFHDPFFLTVTTLSNGSIDLVTELPIDVSNHTASIGFNYTWLSSKGIHTPASEVGGERVRSYASSGGIWYYPIPNDPPVNHTISDETSAIFSLVGDTCEATQSGTLGAAWSRKWFDLEDGLGSWVRLTALSGTFCWDWKITDHPDRENSILWYTIWGEVIDADDPDLGCKTPSTSDRELVVNDEGAAACEWPEGEEINTIIPSFYGTLVEASEYEERYSGRGSWEDCGTGEFGEEVPWIVPVIVGVAIVIGVNCHVRWTEHNWHYIWNNENRSIHRLIVGCIDVDEDAECVPDDEDASSYTTVGISDNNNRRADTWDIVEDAGIYMDSDRTGGQSLIWDVHHISDANGEYSADISIVVEVGDYDTSVIEVGASGDDPHLSFAALEGETDFERTIQIDTVNWEAPENVCAPGFKVKGVIDSVTGNLQLGPWDVKLPCSVDEIPLSNPGDPTEDMGNFKVLNHTLPDGSLEASSGSITAQDVLDWNGDVVRAMVSKVVSNLEFLDSLTNLTATNDDQLPVETSCTVFDTVYSATFTAGAEGTSTIDGLERLADSTIIRQICFENLGITDYVDE